MPGTEDVTVSPILPGPLVLVVDNHLPHRLALSQMIRGLGYPVRSCRRGRDALRFLQSHSQQVRLLVADLGMPGMDGGELVERALDLDPSVRVVLMADLEDPRAADLLAGYQDLPILLKPVRLAEVYGTLTTLVGPPSPTHTPASVRAPRPRTRRRTPGHHEA